MKDNHCYISILSASYVPENGFLECPRINCLVYGNSRAWGKTLDSMSDNVVAEFLMLATLGRPPGNYNKAAAIEATYKGLPRRKILEVLGCSNQQMYNLLAADASFMEEYRQAREAGGEALVESLLTIHEDHPEIEDTNLLRLMSDNIKFCAVKLFPHKYGDRLEIKHGFVDIGSALSEAKQRATIDVTPIPDPFD